MRERNSESAKLWLTPYGRHEPPRAWFRPGTIALMGVATALLALAGFLSFVMYDSDWVLEAVNPDIDGNPRALPGPVYFVRKLIFITVYFCQGVDYPVPGRREYHWYMQWAALFTTAICLGGLLLAFLQARAFPERERVWTDRWMFRMARWLLAVETVFMVSCWAVAWIVGVENL